MQHAKTDAPSSARLRMISSACTARPARSVAAAASSMGQLRCWQSAAPGACVGKCSMKQAKETLSTMLHGGLVKQARDIARDMSRKAHTRGAEAVYDDGTSASSARSICSASVASLQLHEWRLGLS